jgi:energy-coupling factor transport system substrate-specific component
MQRVMTGLIYALTGLIGVAAFVYPFWLPQQTDAAPEQALAVSASTPLLTLLLLILCLGVLLLEVQGQAVSAKIVAALGVLVAVTAVLRFLEVAVPGPGGFSPIFAPIILGGYVFGARFGFLMGALTLLTSALLTGGVGPWLPYQMFAAGWVGLTAGWLPHPASARRELALLAAWGCAWGLLYGLIMNLYFWPFVSGMGAAGWQPAAGLPQALRSYTLFYVTTSLVWDVVRAGGNTLLLLALGAPTVRALTRFRDRFHFQLA